MWENGKNWSGPDNHRTEPKLSGNEVPTFPRKVRSAKSHPQSINVHYPKTKKYCGFEIYDKLGENVVLEYINPWIRPEQSLEVHLILTFL